MCEVAKQIINYSMQYYNNGKYPMPQTIIVVLGEIIKLGITLGRYVSCICYSKGLPTKDETL